MTQAVSNIPLHQRFCHAPGCDVSFFVCPSCDRGQRYCSLPCRRRTRLAQLRAASRRYQASLEGRLGHRDRQRAYRQRQVATASSAPEKSVTHHPSQPPGACVIMLNFAAPQPGRPTTLLVRSAFSVIGTLHCHFCTQASLFLNPFHAPP